MSSNLALRSIINDCIDIQTECSAEMVDAVSELESASALLQEKLARVKALSNKDREAGNRRKHAEKLARIRRYAETGELEVKACTVRRKWQPYLYYIDMCEKSLENAGLEFPLYMHMDADRLMVDEDRLNKVYSLRTALFDNTLSKSDRATLFHRYETQLAELLALNAARCVSSTPQSTGSVREPVVLQPKPLSPGFKKLFDGVPSATETMYKFDSCQPPEAGSKEGGVAPLYKEKDKKEMYIEIKDGQGTSGTVTPPLPDAVGSVGDKVPDGTDKSVIEEKETPNNPAVLIKNSRPKSDPKTEQTRELSAPHAVQNLETRAEAQTDCGRREMPHPDNETPEQKVQRKKDEWKILWRTFGETGDPGIAEEIERRSLKWIERLLYSNISPEGIIPGHAYNAKIEIVEGDGQPQHKNINLYVKELLAEAVADGFTEYVYKGAINLRPYLDLQSPPRRVLNQWHTYITYHRLLDVKRLALATCMLAFREIEYYTRVPTGKQGYFIPIPRPTDTM